MCTLSLLTSLLQSVQADDSSQLKRYKSKLGTLDQYTELFYAILKGRYRNNAKYKETLLE
ncbi:hypothetical protein TWF481_005072 [Arthrobotrys musiformis]|uniref:Uncharacterized protein n=1 Tax=Arthrobotrys musiformis TaxID=47236 RepID=A0AAV9WDD8_9PEZI